MGRSAEKMRRRELAKGTSGPAAMGLGALAVVFGAKGRGERKKAE